MEPSTRPTFNEIIEDHLTPSRQEDSIEQQTSVPTRVKREVPVLLTGARARTLSNTSVVIDEATKQKALYFFLVLFL